MNVITNLAKIDPVLKDKDTAHLVIDFNKIESMNAVPGLDIRTKELEDGIDIKLVLEEGVKIDKPVHMCFGIKREEGIQRINLDIELKKNSRINIIAHCVFPNPKDLQHLMDAVIKVGEGSKYSYFEKHIHGSNAGIKVIPKAKVFLEKDARFKTEFELIKGRVGEIDIDYEGTCKENAVMDMTARISGIKDDIIRINESGNLIGQGAKGVLTSKIAVRDDAKAEINNHLTATAPYARGHVDCKEIVQDNATAKATPIVEVNHPKAHVTHEAAIGSVDSKQLETLMSRGLDEDEAVDLIIDGLLS